MDGDNQQPGSDRGHAPLDHDQPVSLRGPQPPAAAPSVDLTANSLPAPAAPAVQAPAAQGPSAPAAPQPTPNPADQSPTPVAVDPADSAAPVAATEPMPAVDAPVTIAPPPGTVPDGAPHEYRWSGPEFLEHPKTPLWYGSLAGGTLVILVIAWLMMHDVVTVLVLAACAVIFGIGAARKPRDFDFVVDNAGISVGPRHYAWQQFKSFAIVDEGTHSSIDFIPLKRFAPPLSIYYEPKHESQLLGVLSQHLPFSNHTRTWIDALMHKVHF